VTEATAAAQRPAVAPTSVTSMWRRSLQLRVIVVTFVLSLITTALLGALLLRGVSSGLVEARERSTVADATAGISVLQNVLAAADTGATTPAPERLIDAAVTTLSARAGDPALYDVLMLAAPGSPAGSPERGTGLVSETSLPSDLRQAVRADQRLAWTFTTLRYLDGTSRPGLVAGALVSVPGASQYEVYLLYPLESEVATIALVQRATIVTGLLLALALALLTGVMTGLVVEPVRAAARSAVRLSAGHLDERVPVRGDDELAQLARSFNEMAGNLERQIHRLEDLSRLQQRFVSDVSHELRTPLTTIRLAAEVLHSSRADLDAAAERSSELLLGQLDRFEGLLQDLLEVSRFDAGVAVLEPEPTDVSDVVRRVVEQMAPLASSMSSEVQLEAAVGILADVDPRRVERVVRNLLTNALEHGQGNPVDIRVVGDEETVAIGVRDRGVGLRPGEESLVFNRFWRADPARARRVGGSGLGLAISLEDARLHGGWLDAWGAPGQGTHFRLTLPRRAGSVVTASPLPLEPDDIAVQYPSPYKRRVRREQSDQHSVEAEVAHESP
jgi:two-component system, OmpR family, sensor histidine kinase MtrB